MYEPRCEQSERPNCLSGSRIISNRCMINGDQFYWHVGDLSIVALQDGFGWLAAPHLWFAAVLYAKMAPLVKGRSVWRPT